MATQAYKQDGVDIAAGDSFSKFAGNVCRSTFEFSPFVRVREDTQHFRGSRDYVFVEEKLPSGHGEVKRNDGCGTKPIIISAARAYKLAANDLLSMPNGDIVRQGGLPLVATNDLTVSELGEAGTPRNEAFRTLIAGIYTAAAQEGVVMFSGETAEVGPCVGSDDPDAMTKFLWSADVVGKSHPAFTINARGLTPGLVIVALPENGFRVNGYSSFRKALRLKYGERYFDNPEAEEAIRQGAAPSTLYTRFLTHINGWNEHLKRHVEIKAIAHITGGGIVGKFAEDILFPQGLSADLSNLYPPPDIMQKCREWRGMDEEEAYRTFNGGQAFLVVIPSRDVDQFLSLARKFGHDARICGEIVYNKSPRLLIKSGYSGRVLTFP